jgi:multimeric flavodoxin WrbA
MSIILEIVTSYDTLVFATPVYYGSMPARLKAIIDRFYALGSKNMAIRDCFILAVAGRKDKTATDALINYYEYLVNFMGWNNCGELCATGYEEIASIKNSNELKKAQTLALYN